MTWPQAFLAATGYVCAAAVFIVLILALGNFSVEFYPPKDKPEDKKP